MTQRGQLIEALKRHARLRGLTYRELAEKIGVSEASVKRIFSRQTFTLGRLEQICQVLGLSLFQLVRAAEQITFNEASILNEKQEAALAADRKLMSYFYLLLHGQTPEQIERRYQVSRQRTERFLLSLDRLGLIEAHPGLKVRLQVARQVRWLPDGPLMQRYGRQIREDFFAKPFSGPDDTLRYFTARLSHASIAKISHRLRKLVDEVEEMHEVDRELPESASQEVALLLAFRPWATAMLEHSLREGGKRGI